MSRFKNALNARDAHIWTLRGTCVLLILVCLVLALGWMNAPRNLTIHQTLLEDDARKRNFSGELRERVRGIYEIPGRGYRGDRVEIVDRDHWVIRLDLP